MLNPAKFVQAHHSVRFLTALVLFSLTSVHAIASESGNHGAETFRPGEMIMHHISDAHQIHIIGELYIPLPVIVYHQGHLDVFSSSQFWNGFDAHGELQFKPYTASSGVTYENHHESIIISGSHGVHPSPADEIHGHDTTIHSASMDSLSVRSAHSPADSLAAVSAPVSHDEAHEGHTKPLDFSITKTVFGMLLVCVIMILLFVGVANTYKKRKGHAPKGFQNLIEPFILFVRNDVAVPSIGAKKADKYVPFLLTVFFFIWISNLLGLIPFIGGFNVTGTMSVTIVLATIVFIITSVSGNAHYWGHIVWPPGVPLPIKVILVPIEILGVFMKPAVLMIRLTANITAGHIIILAFVGLIILFGQSSAAAGYGVGAGAVLFMVFMFFIELLVAFLQAYVFTLLAAIYFGDATQEHHSHDEEHSHASH
jgi:F-type H+-transporting ATPase subunit a